MCSPSSDDGKNESPRFAIVSKFLLDLQFIKCLAVIVEPFHHIQSQSNNVTEICIQRKEIAHDKVHLMCPAQQHDHPHVFGAHEASHLLSVRAIVRAPSYNNNPEFVEDVLDIRLNNFKQLVTCFRFP